MVSSTPRPHFTLGKDPVPIVQEAGWAPEPVWTGGKSRPYRDSIPDLPARSQSLYRLSYPAHCPYMYRSQRYNNLRLRFCKSKRITLGPSEYGEKLKQTQNLLRRTEKFNVSMHLTTGSFVMLILPPPREANTSYAKLPLSPFSDFLTITCSEGSRWKQAPVLISFCSQLFQVLKQLHLS